MQAVSTASTADQLASASKNLGFAHRKHASMERDFEPRMRNLCTAVRHLGNAFVFGAACKPAAWCAQTQLLTPMEIPVPRWL